MTWLEIIACFIGFFILFHFGVDDAIKLFKFPETVANKWQKSKIRYILLFWLWCLFIASCLNSWIILKYILGVIIISRSLLAIAKNLIQEVQQLEWFLIVEFMLAMIVSCYLIYTIPDDNLQNIVLTIAAAIIGGLITLMGVAWTIKHTNKDRQLANKRFQYDKKLESYQLILEMFDNATETQDWIMDNEHNIESDMAMCRDAVFWLMNSPSFESVQHILKEPLKDETKKNFLIKLSWLKNKTLELKMLYYKEDSQKTMLLYEFMNAYYQVLKGAQKTSIVLKQLLQKQEELAKTDHPLTQDYMLEHINKPEEKIQFKNSIKILYDLYRQIKEQQLLKWMEEQIMI